MCDVSDDGTIRTVVTLVSVCKDTCRISHNATSRTNKATYSDLCGGHAADNFRDGDRKVSDFRPPFCLIRQLLRFCLMFIKPHLYFLHSDV